MSKEWVLHYDRFFGWIALHRVSPYYVVHLKDGSKHPVIWVDE